MVAARRPRFFLGWTVVAAAALVTFAEVAFFNPVLGVFIPEFEREFGWSRTEISAAVTVGSLASAVFAPFFGPLIDRHGGKWFIAGGIFVMGVCLVSLANMQTEWQFFIIYAIGRGMASGLIALAASVTVSKWFIRKRGLAVGVTTLGSRAGFAILPLGVQLIIDAEGWRTAAYVLAATVLTIGILPTLRWLHARPEHFGLEPDGEPRRVVEGETRVVIEREVSWTQREAVRTRAFWLVTAAISLQAWAAGAVNLHQIPHLVDQGLEPEAAAFVITLVAGFSAGGAIIEGVLDEKIGARRTLIIGLLGSAVGMVILMNTTSMAMGVAFAAVYGLAFGLMVTSGQIVFADYFGREALGAIRGSAAPFQMALNAVGPIVGGLAFDLTGSYLAAFVPFTLGYLLAAAMLAIARKPTLPAPAGLREVTEAAG
jgi:MFS family permease